CRGRCWVPSAPTCRCILNFGCSLMIVTLPTQERVDEIAHKLAPDVVRIRLNIGEDWSDHPAIYFRVILADKVSRDRLANVTRVVRGRLFDEPGLAALDHIPYFRFRTQSEQATLQDKAWD